MHVSAVHLRVTKFVERFFIKNIYIIYCIMHGCKRLRGPSKKVLKTNQVHIGHVHETCIQHQGVKKTCIAEQVTVVNVTSTGEQTVVDRRGQHRGERASLVA